MNVRIAADRRLAAISRRDGLRYAGVVALAAAGWLFDPQRVGAEKGKNRRVALDIRNRRVALDISNRRVALDIRNHRVAADQRIIRVSEGDRVELRWTADEAVKLHLHGYDIGLGLEPGAPGSMTFEAHTAGRFPVGIHGSGGHGHGNIIYLEVHPR
jgi:FtsP/CotA-like multicopper oxidase with cupredoxin domain